MDQYTPCRKSCRLLPIIIAAHTRSRQRASHGYLPGERGPLPLSEPPRDVSAVFRTRTGQGHPDARPRQELCRRRRKGAAPPSLHADVPPSARPSPLWPSQRAGPEGSNGGPIDRRIDRKARCVDGGCRPTQCPSPFPSKPQSFFPTPLRTDFPLMVCANDRDSSSTSRCL